MDPELWTFTGNVALALLFGVLIGLERQYRQHPAGLRTNALVCVGAALFVSLSGLMSDTQSPTRVASYIVSGIGFLGGGVILKEGVNVRGMNTAATLWCSAAVGTLAGAGFGVHAAIGVTSILIALTGLRPLARWVDARQKERAAGETLYQVRVVCAATDERLIRTVVTRHVNSNPGMSVLGITVRRQKGRKRVLVRADILAEPANDRAVQEVVSRLTIEPSVRSASWRRLARPGE
ncbi:MAG: putative Mg(2+) transport ATPase [Gemmataceae bacterium]|nr:putative Mg(2+) transport ATPase [Gemmataceae bacterium]